MVNKKFDKFLTVLLIIILIAVFIILGFFGYDIFERIKINNGAKHIIEDFDEKLSDLNNNNNNNNVISNNKIDEQQSGSGNNGNNDYGENNNGNWGWGRSSSEPVTYTYNDFNVVGKIEIPKIDLNYPVFDEATISSMRVSVGIIYGPGLNEIGNTVIMGHNYRNGTLFSNNDQLAKGDEIYITDAYGWRLKYTIYNIYITSSSDFDYAVRGTAGNREITLASCTDDSVSRLIIWARAD